MPAGGQEITGQQGGFGNSISTRIRSLKVDSGEATIALSGSQSTFAQGALGRIISKALTGGAITSAQGDISPTDADADWLARSTAEGVFRTFHFNDSSQLGANQATGPWQTADYFHLDGNTTTPSIATDQKCSGTGSLYFEIPTNTDEGAAGSWETHFGTVGDLRLVGEGDEVFISFRCRWNAAMATITAQNIGTKYTGVEVGRRESYTGSGSFEWDGSAANWAGITTQTIGGTMIPHLYTSQFRRDETPNTVDSGAAQMLTGYPTWGGDLAIQNSYPSPGPCLYAGSIQSGQTATECWVQPTDEWVTFKYHLQVLSRRSASPYNNEYWDISFKFYAARFGEDFTLIHEWSDAHPGYGPTWVGPVASGSADTKIGKFRFLPRCTGKSAAVAHDTGKVWFDELIISSADVAAPGFTTQLTYPAWRSGKTVGQVYAIANTSYMGDPTFATFTSAQQDGMIDAYCGNVMDQTNSRWLIVNGGGHAQTCSSGYTNAVVKMDFTADTPAWTFIDEGTVLADITPNRYMLDGRPAARHTYNKGVYIAPGQMADGKERCGMVTGAAGLAQNWGEGLESCPWTDDTTGIWKQGPGFEMFLMDPDDWFAHNTFDGSVHGWELQNNSRNAPQYSANPGDDAYGEPAQDQRTGDIYWVGTSSGNRRLFKWTALTDTWSSALVDSGVTTTFRGSNASPSFVDTLRNRLVILWFGTSNGSNTTDRLIFVNLSTYAVTDLTLPLQGVTGWGSLNIVHDTDNDRYCFLLQEGSPDGGNLYVYRLWGMSPTTGAISDLSGALPQEHESLGHHMSFIPDLHCLVWMTQYTAPIRFMPTF
jgi:hypothetical protein